MEASSKKELFHALNIFEQEGFKCKGILYTQLEEIFFLGLKADECPEIFPAVDGVCLSFHVKNLHTKEDYFIDVDILGPDNFEMVVEEGIGDEYRITLCEELKSLSRLKSWFLTEWAACLL